MEFNLEPLLNNNGLVVHCPDRDIAVNFVRYIKSQYPAIYFRGCPGESEYWDVYKEKTCYLPRINTGRGMQYSDFDFYLNRGHEIISVYDLMPVMDIGHIDVSEADLKFLFGME